jgi:hypothetical protein
MDSPSFKIVLQHVALERLVEVKRELAKRFEIDEDIASDIAGAAPIILLTDLTFDEAGVVRRRLWSIVDQGGRIVTTDAACDDIPKVNWPETPEVAKVAAGEAQAPARAPAFREVASFRVPGVPEEMKIVVAGPGAPPLPPATFASPAVAASAVAIAAATAGAVAGSAPRGAAPPAPPPPPPPARPAAPEAAPPVQPQAFAPPPLPAPAAPPLPAPAPPAPAPTAAPAPPPAAAPAPPQRAAPAPPAARPHEEPHRRPHGTEAARVLEASPFLRAVEAERERRASARLGTPPAPPPPEPQPSEEADRVPAGRHDPASGLRLDDSDLYERPELPPLPIAGPGEVADDFGGFDIDEALRLLDNAPDAPAPAGTAAAPPPLPAPPPPPARPAEEPARLAAPIPPPVRPAPAPAAPPVTRSEARPVEGAGRAGDATFGGAASDLQFTEIESDVINLEAALERPIPLDLDLDDDLLPATPGTSRRDGGGTPPPARRGGAPEPPPQPETRRGPGRGAIAPLDPLEALSILESAKSPDSSEDVFSRPPSRPVSDELEPLDPNEALAILQTQALPAVGGHAAGRAGGGTQVLASYKEGAAAAAPPASGRKPGERRSFLDSGSDEELEGFAAAPAPAPAAKGGGAPAPLERPAIVDSSDILFDLEEPAAPAREEPVQPRVVGGKSGGKGGSARAVPGTSAPAPQAPPGVKGGASGRAAGGGDSERVPASKRQSGGAARQPGDEEPVHGLVLSKITGEGRRHKAAEIIAELTNISKDEALKLTDRTIIPVLKGVSKSDAESALRRFERSKISGRVTTRRLGE